MKEHVVSGPNGVTQYQIAEDAGVSRSTVAKVLSNTPTSRISETVKTRVLEAAERLGYRPNQYAQIMRKGKTGMIGIINFASHSMLLQRKVVAAVQAILREGYKPHVMDSFWFADASDEVCQHMLDSRVEGVVLAAPSAEFQQKHLDKLLEAGVPVVSISGDHLKGITRAISDRPWGYYTLTKHLLAQGYKRPLFIASNPTPKRTTPYIEAFKRACREEKGVKADVLSMSRIPTSKEQPTKLYPYLPGRIGMQEVLRRSVLPDAVICSNDEWALGALSACVEADVRVPHDMAVVGFEDEPVSEFGMMPLTTVAHPVEEIAEHIVQELLKEIRGQKKRAPETITLKGKLIIRRSCGSYLRNTPQVPPVKLAPLSE